MRTTVRSPPPPTFTCRPARHWPVLSIIPLFSYPSFPLCHLALASIYSTHIFFYCFRCVFFLTPSVSSHTCWALSHLCDGLSTHIRAVVDADICWRLVELLKHRRYAAGFVYFFCFHGLFVFCFVGNNNFPRTRKLYDVIPFLVSGERKSSMALSYVGVRASNVRKMLPGLCECRS